MTAQRSLILVAALLACGCTTAHVAEFPASPATAPANPQAIVEAARAAGHGAETDDAAHTMAAFAAGAVHGPLEIHFIDVGQGDATLIVCPNGDRILVDCGSSTPGFDSGPVRDYVLNNLGEDQRVEALFITHPDADHYNRLEDVLDGVQIDHIYAVAPADEHTHRRTNAWLGTSSDNYTILTRDQHSSASPSALGDFGDVEVYVLAANVRSTRSGWAKNTASIVLKITYGTFDVVLTGDATHETENDIIERFASNLEYLDVEVLKIGHHGSEATSTSVHWAAATRPDVAVVSAGHTNGYGYPRREVIQRLYPYTRTVPKHKFRWAYRDGSSYKFVTFGNQTKAVYCTSVNGNIVVSSDGETFDVRSNN